MYLVLSVKHLNLSLDTPIVCLSRVTQKALDSLGYQYVELFYLSVEVQKKIQDHEKLAFPLVNQLLFTLGPLLNELHRVDFSQNAWRCMLGWWCYHLVSLCIDRYYRLEGLREKYPDVAIVGFAYSDVLQMVPQDLSQFIALLKSEEYNAVFVTLLAQYLQFPVVDSTIITVSRAKAFPHLGLWSKLKRKVYILIYKVLVKRARVLLETPYFHRRVCIRLFVGSFGKVLPLPKNMTYNDGCVSDQIRKTFASKLGAQDTSEFLIDMMCKFIPYTFPVSHLEAFSSIKKAYSLFCQNSVKAIFTSNGWYVNEKFKFLSAFYYDQGKKIVGASHGGCAFLKRMYHIRFHEVLLSRVYYSWGIYPEKSFQNVKGMVPPKASYWFQYSKKALGENNVNQILYCTTSCPSFTVNLDSLPEQFERYLFDMDRFLGLASDTLKKKLLVRTHWEEMGWEIRKRIQIACPEIKFDSWDKSFYESISESSLLVCDHLSTTYAEALMVGKPFILFFDLEAGGVLEDATPLFAQLEKVGIYHQTPGSAIEHLSRIAEDVNGWWQASDVQSVVAWAQKNIANYTPDVYSVWKKNFEQLC